jgi:hypothetical protein
MNSAAIEADQRRYRERRQFLVLLRVWQILA